MAKSSSASLDASNMFDVLYRFPEQVKEALAIGESAPVWRRQATSNRYVILGLGGSAIGGDLLRSFAAGVPGGEHLNIVVSRGYTAPAWIDSDTNVIASSYSGDTEETLSAFDDARKRSDRFVVITTGGQLGKKAITYGMPVINIPPGYQPRCALAYSFFPLLSIMQRTGALDSRSARPISKGIKEIFANVDEMRDLYSSKSAKNPALALAKKLHGTVPVIYSAQERMDAVNLRWRGQIQENAKQLAFGNLLPEMNHNEINGWFHPADIAKQTTTILLRDAEDHPRTAIRFDALADIIKKHTGSIVTVEGKGSSLLSRMITAIYFGDWVSYHLAILNEVDPSPVPVIMTLKSLLAKAK
jgi:glucose/mannose-6-phosphate isomerase